MKMPRWGGRAEIFSILFRQQKKRLVAHILLVILLLLFLLFLLHVGS
jgi:hypothetical protein